MHSLHSIFRAEKYSKNFQSFNVYSLHSSNIWWKIYKQTIEIPASTFYHLVFGCWFHFKMKMKLKTVSPGKTFQLWSQCNGFCFSTLFFHSRMWTSFAECEMLYEFLSHWNNILPFAWNTYKNGSFFSWASSHGHSVHCCFRFLLNVYFDGDSFILQVPESKFRPPNNVTHKLKN